MRAKDLAPLMVVAGSLLLTLMILSLCAMKGRTMAECDRDHQIPLLILGLSSAVFAWVSTPPR
jgi:hypothetical protein